MEENEFPLDKIAASLNEVLEQVSSGQIPALRRFAELQERRATHLSAAEARLKSHLGEDHPRVIALRRAASSAGKLKRTLSTTAERIARRPKISPHEWVVFGQVLDPEGKPVPGVRVRVFDRDRKYDDLLGDTTTDEYGDFSAIYHERDFAEVGEELPELYVMVRDSQGNLLYSSRENVRYNAGRAEYFQIILSEEPPGKTPEQTKEKG